VPGRKGQTRSRAGVEIGDRSVQVVEMIQDQPDQQGMMIVERPSRACSRTGMFLDASRVSGSRDLPSRRFQ
jgi:hypothetical protein